MNKTQQDIVNSFLSIENGHWEIYPKEDFYSSCDRLSQDSHSSKSVWLVKRNPIDQSVLDYLTVFSYGETKRGLYEERG